MNKNLLSFLLAMVIVMLSLFESSAQIKYIDGRLTIGEGVSSYYYFDIIANARGVYLKGLNSSFLRLDVSQSQVPMISGYGDGVMFYNPISGNYNVVIAHSVYTGSNASAQANLRNLSNGMDIIRRLRPVSYTVASPLIKSTTPNIQTESNVAMGLVAEELEDVLPNLVFTDNKGHKSIDYISLVPVLIDAVKTLQQEVESLKAKLNDR